MTDWQELEHKYLMHTFDRIPVVLVRGKGARVWDDKGKEYLDFVGGLAVDSIGHAHPVLAEAVCEQARTLIQVCNLFYSVPQIQLAEMLVNNSCLNKVFFCNSGAEANEGAVKLARRYGARYLNGAYEVITALNSFHGRTLAMVAASGQPRFQKPYEPLPSGFVNVEYDSIKAVQAATSEKTCAVMLEPIQGEGGVNVPSENYLKEVRQWCDQKGILLILDEIQTGLGRLGSLFGYQEYGVEPDVITLAKGLGSGVPIGAFMAKERAAVFVPGEHGSTFGGNPLACAAGLAVLKFMLDNGLPASVKRTGDYLAAGLRGLQKKYSSITDVRGRGLLMAIEFDRDMAGRVLTACLERSLLVNAVKPNALRFIPPLIIGNSEVDEALGILDEALQATG